jgi:2-hydroxy-3-keto-5-methylthiopentenyl-1-phosphate phosphatase
MLLCHLLIVVYNSGMTPTIRAVLSNLVGEEDAKDIDIISNDVVIQPNGRWDIKYRHPTR